jgi:hypothetical protein
MVEQGILCWPHEAMRRWKRCSFASKSHHGLSNADAEDPLDDLSDLAASLFSPILNRGQNPLPSISDHPFGPGEKGVRLRSTLTSHLCGQL